MCHCGEHAIEMENIIPGEQHSDDDDDVVFVDSCNLYMYTIGGC